MKPASARWLTSSIAAPVVIAIAVSTVFVVAAIGAERMFRWARRDARPDLPDLAWIVPGVVFVGWQGIIHTKTGRFGFTGDDASGTLGIRGAWPCRPWWVAR